MNDDIEVQYITDPRQLPSLFVPLPEPWDHTLSQLRRLTSIKIGRVFVYETQYGKRSWKIIGAEVLNEEDFPQADHMGASIEAPETLDKDERRA